MPEWLRDVPGMLKGLGDQIPIVVALWATIIILLFIPTLHPSVDSLVSQYQGYLIVLLIFLSVFIVIVVLKKVWQAIQNRLNERHDVQSKYQRLHRLTPNEQRALRNYFRGNTRIQSFVEWDDGIPSLVRDGILRLAPDYSTRNRMGHMVGEPKLAGYLIEEWAWVYLQGHRELLGND